MGCLLGRQIPVWKTGRATDGSDFNCSSPSEGEANDIIIHTNPPDDQTINSHYGVNGPPSARNNGETKETLTASTRIDREGNKIVNEYVIIKTLGSGSYGKVKLCINIEENEFYAIKMCHKGLLARRRTGSTNALQDVLREIAILKKLNHKNVVKLYEVIDDPNDDRLYMVMEYVQGGPVMRLENMKPLTDHEAWKYFRDIVSGLEYLHSMKIIHRDIKPENLLVSADGIVKISDFGVSYMFEGDDDTLTRTAGSPAFYAPELCEAGTHPRGKAVDIYAMGVSLYCMVFGRVPFMAESVMEMYEKIRNEKLKFPFPISRDLEDLLRQLLEKDPERRITTEDIKNHPWVTCSGSLMLQDVNKVPLVLSSSDVENAIDKNSKLIMVKLKSRLREMSTMAQTRLAERCRQAAASTWMGGDVSDSDTDTSNTTVTSNNVGLNTEMEVVGGRNKGNETDSSDTASVASMFEQQASSDGGQKGRKGGNNSSDSTDSSSRAFTTALSMKQRSPLLPAFFVDETKRQLSNAFDPSLHVPSPQTKQFVNILKDWEMKKQQHACLDKKAESDCTEYTDIEMSDAQRDSSPPTITDTQLSKEQEQFCGALQRSQNESVHLCPTPGDMGSVGMQSQCEQSDTRVIQTEEEHGEEGDLFQMPPLNQKNAEDEEEAVDIDDADDN